MTLPATPCAIPVQLSRALVLLAVVSWASMAFAHGAPSERLALLDAVIEGEPNSVSHLLDRSELHRRHGRFDMAIGDLLRAQSISPDEHRIDHLLGRNHLEKGDFANAETTLRRYVDIVPGSSSGHVALAHALSGQHRHLEAARHYELAIAAQPTPVPDHFLGRARAYWAAGGPHIDQAINGLDEAMDALGPLVALQKLAIGIELARRNPDGAIDRVDQILAGARRQETWLVRKGRILADTGRHDEARAAYRSARDALESLPARVRSSAAMLALDRTASRYLDDPLRP